MNKMNSNKSNFMLLVWGIILMIIFSIYPFIFVDANNKVNHIGLIFLLWSMSSAFVCGIGFIPKNTIARFLLNASVSIISAVIAFIILYILN